MLLWLRPSKQIQPLIFSFKQPAQQRKIVATYELLYALLIGSLIALIHSKLPPPPLSKLLSFLNLILIIPLNLFIIDGIKQCQSYTSTTACVNRKSISYAGVKPLKSNSCVNVCASSSNVPITAIDPVNVKIDITLNDQTRSIDIPIAQRRMKFDQIEWCEPFFKTNLKKWSFVTRSTELSWNFKYPRRTCTNPSVESINIIITNYNN
ncbi:hypothetical protein PSHT_10352 [Puccinia striiformis]|uniref:Uncharacterized protein n=1 Tax=Puccinia striiformis TaxID=27350 RepID=A0A2S4VAV7_9BASI|nr:hypothetical protein PSHT_10352 [Puccinia striiformis]